ncbi:glycosyltransferase [Rhizobium sp. B230/85]|uniref:glycosyltransferase n=1 Tax=unclassified Rhizobium TaxID=2613769 RepID=UPI001ADA6AF0|nr:MULTISPECIES: glycosyltransferase [unclassified Rhizobium]MBO9136788.1 glycosyltransferase [Rhizobium sp. B209b/85]QXZ99064.1 glycosyltransferase [Rhizobium sp. B230/85]
MTKAEIDVSVYIPTRNRSKSVRRAIRSVLQQTHRKLEVIVVNDASTDDTYTVIETMKTEDERVRVIHQPTARGAPIARNAAIAIAQGHFITGLDDDDAFEETRIARFMDAWRKFQDLSITPSGLYSQSRMLREGQASVSQRPNSVGLSDLFVQNDIGNQLFAPKSHYEVSGLFDPDMPAWQDLDLFIRMVKTFGRACLVDGATYLYDDDDRADRISGKGDKVRQAARLIIDKHSATYPNIAPLLTMQMFNGYYSIEPTLQEFRLMLASGKPMQGIKRGVKAALRQRLGLGKSFL